VKQEESFSWNKVNINKQKKVRKDKRIQEHISIEVLEEGILHLVVGGEVEEEDMLKFSIFVIIYKNIYVHIT
jgi:hypothetical protein